MSAETESPFKDETENMESAAKPKGHVAQALEMIRDTKRVSLSILERKLGLPLEKASLLLDHLEKHNIIAGPDGEKKNREILIDLSEPLPKVPELLSLVPKPVTRKKKTMPVACQLSDAEIIEASQKMFEVEDELTAKQLELKDFKETNKEEQGEIKTRLNRFKSMVREGVEDRDLECEITLDYEKETYTCIRLDTGEPVEERKMTPGELSELPMDEQE